MAKTPYDKLSIIRQCKNIISDIFEMAGTKEYGADGE